MKKFMLLLTLLISAQSFAAGYDLSKSSVIGRKGMGSNTFEYDGKSVPCEIKYTAWGTFIIDQPQAYYSDLGGIDGKKVEQVNQNGDTLVLRTGKAGTHSNSFLCGRGFGTSQGEYTEAKISDKRVEITTSYRCLPNPVRESFTYYCDLK